MPRPTIKDPFSMFAVMLAVALVWGALLVAGCGNASASDYRQGIRANTSTYVLPSSIYKAGYTPSVYWRVSADLEEQAENTKLLKNSPLYDELRELRAWKAGFEARSAEEPVTDDEAAEDEDTPADSPMDVDEEEGEEPTESASPAFNLQTFLDNRCATCHSGEDPPKGLIFEDAEGLRANPEKLIKAGKAVVNQKMPVDASGKHVELDPQEEYNFLRTLFLNKPK
jgi:hypothetical protein